MYIYSIKLFVLVEAYCFLDIEVNVKNNKKQNKKQTVENRVHKYGANTSLHAHQIKWPILSGHLKQCSWWQKCKQCRSYEWCSPIVHPQPYKIVQNFTFQHRRRRRRRRRRKKNNHKGIKSIKRALDTILLLSSRPYRRKNRNPLKQEHLIINRSLYPSFWVFSFSLKFLVAPLDKAKNHFLLLSNSKVGWVDAWFAACNQLQHLSDNVVGSQFIITVHFCSRHACRSLL